MPLVERVCQVCNEKFWVWPSVAVKPGCGKYCSIPCQNIGMRGSRRTLEDRFWSKVQKTETCWLWTGHQFTGGYGDLHVQERKKHVLVHRLSWELHYGPIPDGLWILHHCDVRNCVRPDHLFLGDRFDNARDCVAKGRTAKGTRNGSRLRAKLSEQQVRDIRKAYADGTASSIQLGHQYCVSDETVRQIVHRKKWADIPDEVPAGTPDLTPVERRRQWREAKRAEEEAKSAERKARRVQRAKAKADKPSKLTLEERFWRFVRRGKYCWEWTGSLNQAGYGQFSIEGIPRKAHRISYELHYGMIPSGITVGHICGNRACVNPAHLTVLGLIGKSAF